MIAHLQHQAWWPTISADAEEYCKTCESCQVSKKGTQRQPTKLHTMDVRSGPLQTIAVDFQGPLVKAKWLGKDVDFLCNWIDTFSGEVISIPCEQTITAQGCADLFFQFVFPQWGTPKQIVSDRDPRWTSTVWKEIFKGLGTTLLLSTSFHPQTNGRIERMHRDLNATMRQVLNETQTNWPDQLPFVVHALNSSKSATTGFSAYELARVIPPNTLPGWARAPEGTPAAEILDRATSRQQRARDNILKARAEQAFQANKKRARDTHVTEKDAVGKLFLVKTENLACAPDRARKWVAPWADPFECVSFTPATSSYTLRLSARYSNRRIHPTSHRSQVKPWAPNDEDRFPKRLFNPKPLFPVDATTLTEASTPGMGRHPDYDEGQQQRDDEYRHDSTRHHRDNRNDNSQQPIDRDHSTTNEVELPYAEPERGPSARPRASLSLMTSSRELEKGATPTDTVVAEHGCELEPVHPKDRYKLKPPKPLAIRRIQEMLAEPFGGIIYKVYFKGQTHKKTVSLDADHPDIRAMWDAYYAGYNTPLTFWMTREYQCKGEGPLWEKLRNLDTERRANGAISFHTRRIHERDLADQETLAERSLNIAKMRVDRENLLQQVRQLEDERMKTFRFKPY